MSIVALFILVLLCVAALPHYPYSRHWGYYPSLILAAIFVIVLVSAVV